MRMTSSYETEKSSHMGGRRTGETVSQEPGENISRRKELTNVSNPIWTGYQV
jgi:hypothetical protein